MGKDLGGKLPQETAHGCSFCEEENFIPVLEFDREVSFPREKASVSISIYANGDILAKLKDTDIAAEGASIEEAIAALKLEIEEEYYFLREMKENLSNHLKKQFDVIKKFYE
jgi:hypothetical protein